MTVELSVQNIITFVALLGAVAYILKTTYTAVHKFDEGKKLFDENNRQQKDIADIREEQAIIIYALLMMAKSMKAQGFNTTIDEAISSLEKHINKIAHGVEE